MQNLRTQLTKIIRRAWLEAWPKLWRNLRAIHETELAEVFPAHVVSAWIGNSQAVAAKYYLQVTDEHFECAARPGEAMQNPVQHSAASGRATPHNAESEDGEVAFCGALRRDATLRDSLGNQRMGDTGLEPLHLHACAVGQTVL